MSRLFRAFWADRSLLLVLVPIALLLTAFLANRTAAEQAAATSATSSTTTTTTAEAADGSTDEVAAPPTTTDAETASGFATGGRTVTDDAGNLVRIPNDVARLPDAEVQGNVLEGGAPDPAPPTTSATGSTATTTPTATTRPSATTAPATTSPATTSPTTVPGTTTTTIPVEPNPVVSESPLTILLPVSGVVAVGLAWIVISRRRSEPAP